MAVIITTTNKSVKIQTDTFTWNPTKAQIKGQIPFENGTFLQTVFGEVPLFYHDTTGDGNSFASASELQEFIETNCFKSAAPAGTGVQSIQAGPGISVDNSDPDNPEVSAIAAAPTWEQIQLKPAVIAAGTTAAAARTAIGLGSASTRPATDFDASGSAAAAQAAANAYTDGKVASVYRVKPAVATVGDLPSSGNEIGDVRDVQETSMNYVWTGTAWDQLGPIINVTWDSLEKPTYLAAGETAATARDAIGAQGSLSIPSQAEAEAGTETTARSITAQRLRQGANAAIDAREWFGTQAQYDTLPSSKLTDGVKYFIEQEA